MTTKELIQVLCRLWPEQQERLQCIGNRECVRISYHCRMVAAHLWAHDITTWMKTSNYEGYKDFDADVASLAHQIQHLEQTGTLDVTS